jgi:hypothetical protein
MWGFTQNWPDAPCAGQPMGFWPMLCHWGRQPRGQAPGFEKRCLDRYDRSNPGGGRSVGGAYIPPWSVQPSHRTPRRGVWAGPVYFLSFFCTFLVFVFCFSFCGFSVSFHFLKFEHY